MAGGRDQAALRDTHVLIEWLRRNNPHFAKELKEYLFTEKPLLEVEDEGKKG